MKPNDRFSKIVALGKKRVMLRFGVLSWGLSCATLFTAWTYYSEGTVGMIDIALLFTLFPIGGIGWGAYI